MQVTELCGSVLGWEADWMSALADLGISLFFKDQNKYKLLRYGGEYVEKRKEPLKKGSRFISYCPVDAVQGISKALTHLVHSHGSTSLAGHVLCLFSASLEHSQIVFRQVLDGTSPSPDFLAPSTFLFLGVGDGQVLLLHSFEENERPTHCFQKAC